MTLEEYEAFTQSTSVYPGKGELMGLLYVTLGLAGEVGEVAGKMAKVIRDDGGIITPERRKALLKEVGDCAWFISRVSAELDSTLEEILESNKEKLSDRKARGVLKGDGDDR